MVATHPHLSGCAASNPRNWLQSALLCRLLIVLLAVLPAPIAASQTQGKNAPMTLTVYALPQQDGRAIEDKAGWAVVHRFMELHPNVKLLGFHGLQVPGMTMETGPLLAMAGGVAPDVLYVNFRMSDSYIQQKFLYPLDGYFKQWAKQEDLHKKIYPPVWKVIKRDGHIWAVPFDTLVMTLQYRKDLFRAAGLDPSKPPRTWKEFYRDAKLLTIPEKGQYGLAVASGPQAAWWWIDLLWSAGGEAVQQDKHGEWHATFNDKGAVEALKFYQKLGRGPWTRNGKTYRGVAYRDVNAADMWALGKIGMVCDYLGDEAMAKVNPNLIGIAPVPRGPTGVRGNELNCRMMGINSQIKDKRVRDMAWEYIKFWASDEAARIRCKAYVDNGYASLISPKYLREFGYTQYLKSVPKGWEKTFDEALRSGHPEPYGRNCEMIYSEMTPPLDAVWLSDRHDYKALLDRAVQHCNEKLMGIVPPQVREFRNRIAGVVVTVLVTLFVLIFRMVMRSFSEDYESTEAPPIDDDAGRRSNAAKRRRTWIAFLIMGPALVSVALWSYLPLAAGSVMAFQNYKIIAGTKWVGLDNFSQVLFTPQVWKSFWNSFVFMLLSLGLGFFTPIILGIMLQEVPRLKILYRTIYYLPAVTTGLVIMFLWKFFYSPAPTGLLNTLLADINGLFLAHINACLAIVHLPLKIPLLQAQTWLQDPHLAMICVVIPIVWAGAGPGSIIYLAALKNVPEDVYEAADLDGAGVLQKITHITIPYLRPLILINFVGAFIAAFRSFDFIFAMTGGGPMLATHVAGLEIWYDAFLYLKFGFAVAMAWLLGSIVVGFTVFQLRILSRLQFKTAKV